MDVTNSYATGRQVEFTTDPTALQARLRRAVDRGFDAIELRIQQEIGSGAELRSVVTSISSVKVLALSAAIELVDPSTSHHHVVELFEIAEACRASVVNLGVACAVGAYGPTWSCLLAELLSKSRFEAEAHGVTIAVDVGKDFTCLGPMALRGIIDDVPSWAVGACVDLRCSETALNFLHTLGRRVRCIRVAESEWERLSTIEAPASANHCPSADGEALGLALEEIRYEGPIIIVPDNVGCDA